MDRFKLAVAGLFLSAGTILFAACATAPPPVPAPAPAPVLMPSGEPPPPDEWNIFPDPTTGQVDIYNRGDYVGAVTGNEPANEDPPIPRVPVRR